MTDKGLKMNISKDSQLYKDLTEHLWSQWKSATEKGISFNANQIIDYILLTIKRATEGGKHDR